LEGGKNPITQDLLNVVAISCFPKELK
jgi:hypothetical protein